MKKIFSMLIAVAFFCTLLPGYKTPAFASYTDGDNMTPGGDFESGLSTEFIANASAGQKSTLTRVAKAGQTKTNSVLSVSARNPNAGTNGVAYDLGELFREKDTEGNYKYLGENGMFYISAKIRLAKEGDTAYARSSIYKWSDDKTKRGTIWWGSGSGWNYKVGSDDWTEIGVRNHATIKYYNFSNTGIDADWLADSGNKVKLQFAMFTDAACTTPYTGDFYMDDVSFFFIEGANQNTPTDCGESLLDNSDFEDVVDESPVDYSGTKAADWGKEGTTWFAENASIKVQKITEETQSEEVVDPEGVHAGFYGLKVTDRPGTQLGVGIELTAILNELGKTQAGEVYHISAWMKTVSPEAEMDVVPIWGNAAPVGNAYLEGNSTLSFHVTNEWTEIGFDVEANQYYTFNLLGNTDTPDQYDPDSATWSSLRFNTIGSTADYYIDDIRIWKTTYSVDEMKRKIEALPSVEKILPTNRAEIVHVRNLYNMFSTTDQTLIDNRGKIDAAEEELLKFETTMEFVSGTVSEEKGVLYIQPNRSYDEIYADIIAENGIVTIYTAEGAPATMGYISTGMCIKLSYKDIELQSVNVVAYGDANGNGKCDVVDLVIAKKYIAQERELTELQAQALNVSADSTEGESITDADVTQIRKYLAGGIQKF